MRALESILELEVGVLLLRLMFVACPTPGCGCAGFAPVLARDLSYGHDRWCMVGDGEYVLVAVNAGKQQLALDSLEEAWEGEAEQREARIVIAALGMPWGDLHSESVALQGNLLLMGAGARRAILDSCEPDELLRLRRFVGEPAHAWRALELMGRYKAGRQ